MSLERLRRELQHTMKLLEERRGKLILSLCSPVKCRSGRHTSRPSSDKRPNTAAVMVGRFAQCERVQQLEREATRCPSLEPAPSSSAGGGGPSAKRNKAPPWQTQCSPLVPYLVGPGYILSRGKSKYDISRSTCSLALTAEEEEQKKLQGEVEREVLIAQLQQQVSDLTLFLEEERLNHRQTKQKAEEYLRDRLDHLQSQHKEHTREVTARHKEEALKQKTKLDSEFTDYQTNTENHIRKLSKDVEQLQGAFEAYKSVLQDELHEKWLTMEGQLRAQCSQAVHTATLDMKNQVMKEKAADRAEAVKDQRRSIEALRKEHKKDMDNVFRTYSREAAGLERLKKTTSELTGAKGELATMRTRYQDSSSKLASATRHLTDMKVQMIGFEEQFQEKVTEVNDKYRYKLHNLMTHNVQLRQLYTDKCGQLFDEQANTDTRVRQQVKAAQAAMESQKTKSKQSEESGSKPRLSNPSHQARPASAPGTPQETKLADHLRETEVPLHVDRDSYHAEYISDPPEQDPETEPPCQELSESAVDHGTQEG